MPNVALRKVLLKKEYDQWREDKVTRLINAMSEEDICRCLMVLYIVQNDYEKKYHNHPYCKTFIHGLKSSENAPLVSGEYGQNHMRDLVYLSIFFCSTELQLFRPPTNIKFVALPLTFVLNGLTFFQLSV